MGNVLKKSIQHSKEKTSGVKRRLRISSVNTTTGEHDLETFLFIWVDPAVSSNEDNLRTQRKLREISTSLITFDEFNSLEQFLHDYTSKQKIVLIVSGAYGREIVPKIHNLPMIMAIHVYCLDVEGNIPWTKDFSKIRSIVSTRKRLLNELSATQLVLENREDARALSILPSEPSASASANNNASFLWFQLFLEVLISSDYFSVTGSFDELVHILRQYSSDDADGLKLIDTFQQTYRANQAISWLTRETPLARFLTKALRERDLNILFALRFLLRDIHAELTNKQIRSITAYKIQAMSQAQMEALRATPGGLLMVDNFLFASTEMSRVLSSTETHETLETVLWEIEAEDGLSKSPFAQLDSVSSDESGQVLFMCGSVFEIGPLICENMIWKLRLKLVGPEHAALLKRLKETLRSSKNPYIIVDLLEQCEETTKAAIISQKLLVLSTSTPTTVTSPLVSGLQCLLVCLSDHHTKFSSMVLTTLRSMTLNTIFLVDDASIDFSRWPAQSLLVFTTAEWFSQSKDIPNEVDVYVLEDEDGYVDGIRRFESIDHLISQLSDRVIEDLRSSAQASRNAGDTQRANKIEEKTQQLCRELTNIADSVILKTQSTETIQTSTPLLFWLTRVNANDKDDQYRLKTTLGKYFLSFTLFHDASLCYRQISKHEHENYIFLVMNPSDYNTSLEDFEKAANVKFTYCYGKEKDDNQSTICDPGDLIYRLTCDLMEHYEKLARQYQSKKENSKARKMFLQAKDLCLFLSETCFA